MRSSIEIKLSHGATVPGSGHLTFQCFFNTSDWIGFRGVQEAYFATTRSLQNPGNSGDFASEWGSETMDVKLSNFLITCHCFFQLGRLDHCS